MSTSTPRIQRIDYYIRNSENACAISEAIELQEELTAALARIAELEKKIPVNLAERCFEAQLSETDVFEQLQVLCGGRPVDECLEPGYEWVVSDSWTDHYDGSVEVIMRGENRINREIADKILDLGFSCIYETHGEAATLWSRKGSEPCTGRKASADNHQLVATLRAKLESLTRQLSESQAQLAEVQGQLSDAEEGLRYGDSQLRKIKELEAQLASAREDSARAKAAAEAMLSELKIIAREEYRKWIGHPITPQACLAWVKARSHAGINAAIDSARGVTSPPAVAETGEKDATPCIRWSYSSYRATLKLDGKHWAIVSPDGRNALSAADAALLERAMNSLDASLLPPPPQGKEKQG